MAYGAVATLRTRFGYDAQHATSAERHAFAAAEAKEALQLLLADRVVEAEALLRDGLTQPVLLPAVVRACLLNGLALAALHDDRPADFYLRCWHGTHGCDLPGPLPRSALRIDTIRRFGPVGEAPATRRQGCDPAPA